MRAATSMALGGAAAHAKCLADQEERRMEQLMAIKIEMQRYGPPPSYPSLKIPGLNAPIPPGAKFGCGHGDWGKPPVDEYGRPLYGDVFGILQQDQPNYELEPVDKTKHWGDLEEEEEQIEEEELEDGIQSVDSLSSE